MADGAWAPGRAGRRLEAWAAPLLLVLLPAALFRDVLLGRKVFYSLDILPYIEPKSAEILRALAALRFPHWFANLNCGQPFQAAVDNAVLSPFNLLLFLGPRRWVEVAAPLWCALAALALYAWLREWALARAAAAVGGLSFGASGLLVFYFDNPPYLNGAFYLPLVLLLWHRALARASLAWLGLAAAALALMVTAGDPEAVYLTAALALPYGFLVPRPPGRRWAPLASYAGLGAGALLLAAVQLLPGIELLREAPRRLPLEVAQESSFHPLRLVELLVPFAYGLGLPGSPYVGQLLHKAGNPVPWTRSIYLGLLPLVVAPLAFAERRTRRLALLVAAAGTAALLASFGPELPVYAWLFRFLPLFASFRVPSKLWLLVVLALSILVALGVERGLARPRSLRGPALLALLLAMGGAAAVFFPPGPPLEATLRAPASRLAGAAALLALLLAVAPGRGAAAPLLVLFHAADLASVNARVALYFGDPRAAPSAPVAAARAILEDARAEPGPIRIYHYEGLLAARGFTPPAGLNPLEARKLWDRVSLDWNHAWTWGLEEVRGYASFHDGRTFALRDAVRAQPAVLARVLQRLNARYFLAPAGPEPPPGARLVAEVEGGAVRVVRLGGALPRLFLARLGRVAERPEAALAALVRPDFDPRVVAFLEVAAEDLPFAGVVSESPLGEVELVSYEPGRVRARVTVTEPRYLLLNEAGYRGWTARVDGALRPAHRANFLMTAVAVRPGEREVELVYRPASFTLGLGLSGAAWAALVLLLAVSARRARGRRA